MTNTNQTCFRCGESRADKLQLLYGYPVCQDCESKLGLFHDATIKKHFLAHQKAKQEDPKHLSYEEEVSMRLALMEKDYIRKRIKLLHIQDRLGHIE